MILLLLSIVLILFGILIDFITKKKGYKLDLDKDLKKQSEYGHFHKGIHLNQSIDNFNNHDS